MTKKVVLPKQMKPVSIRLILIGGVFGGVFLPNMAQAQWDMEQGKMAATKAVLYVQKLCAGRHDCLSELGLSTTSTAVSARSSGLNTDKAFSICTAGFGQGKASEFLNCVNYLRGE